MCACGGCQSSPSQSDSSDDERWRSCDPYSEYSRAWKPFRSPRCGDGKADVHTIECSKVRGGGCGKGLRKARCCETIVEACDRKDLNGANCESLGFSGGTLSCNQYVYDVRQCGVCIEGSGKACQSMSAGSDDQVWLGRMGSKFMVVVGDGDHIVAYQVSANHDPKEVFRFKGDVRDVEWTSKNLLFVYASVESSGFGVGAWNGRELKLNQETWLSTRSPLLVASGADRVMVVSYNGGVGGLEGVISAQEMLLLDASGRSTSWPEDETLVGIKNTRRFAAFPPGATVEFNDRTMDMSSCQVPRHIFVDDPVLSDVFLSCRAYPVWSESFSIENATWHEASPRDQGFYKERFVDVSLPGLPQFQEAENKSWHVVLRRTRAHSLNSIVSWRMLSSKYKSNYSQHDSCRELPLVRQAGDFEGRVDLAWRKVDAAP